VTLGTPADDDVENSNSQTNKQKDVYVKQQEQRTTLNTTLQSMFHVSPLINSLVTKAESALLERELCPVAGETDV
jgi:hypothetical protein